MRRSLFALIGVLALATSAGPGRAAPVDADPNEEYRVTPAAGRWLIIVKSYTGPLAPQMAHDLILLLRSRDKLPAYLYVRGEEDRHKQEEYIAEMHRLCPDVQNMRIRKVRIEVEYAVLVGGYPDMDTAARALVEVKRLKPPEDARLMDKVTRIVPAPGGEHRSMIQEASVNPFVSAFAVPNPTVPQQVADHNKPDAALKSLNEGRPYNLLACRHPWTVVVKDFQGAGMLQMQGSGESFLSSLLGFSKKSADLLTANAQQAEEVARVLREMKFDAYVLHTRTNSIVTVGGYDRPDDPQLRQMQRQLSNLKLGPFQCFAQPMPMQVPQL
jgi:hypothetical protein